MIFFIASISHEYLIVNQTTSQTLYIMQPSGVQT